MKSQIDAVISKESYRGRAQAERSVLSPPSMGTVGARLVTFLSRR